MAVRMTEPGLATSSRSSLARLSLRSLGAAVLGGVVFIAVAQTQQPPEKKRLTVLCYWQNTEALVIYRLSKNQLFDWSGCEKYADPTHCQRTAAQMLMDTDHDWERVIAKGLIYTIRCKRKCSRIPVESQTYDAETDGKFMWITFERPDNRNLLETFEIFDISPMKESAEAAAEPADSVKEESTTIVGTAFFVSEHGYLLTNVHVVSDCKQIQTRDGRTARLLSGDEQIDLALLKVEGESPAVATFRIRPAPRVGDSIITFGFPLQGVLSSEGNLSTGTVAATTGLGDDPRFMQVSAPIQPGNSGSPLLDSGGDVIGVMEAKLDAMKTLRLVGDIPENVNFAIRGSEAVQFLERNHVAYHAATTESSLDLKVADVAARAKQFSLPIECLK